LFEKLTHEKKQRVYFGLKIYSDYCLKSGQDAMDLEKFIRKEFYMDYQKKVEVVTSAQTNKEKSLSEIWADSKKTNFDIELTAEEVKE